MIVEPTCTPVHPLLMRTLAVSGDGAGIDGTIERELESLLYMAAEHDAWRGGRRGWPCSGMIIGLS